MDCTVHGVAESDTTERLSLHFSGLEGWGVPRCHGTDEFRGAGKASDARPRTLGFVSAQRTQKGYDPLMGPDHGVTSSLTEQGGAGVGGGGCTCSQGQGPST